MQDITKEVVEQIEESLLDIDLVQAIAGDRAASDEERKKIELLLQQRGGAFYSDVLFTLTKQRFDSSEAHALWKDIMVHEKNLEHALGRKVGISVATLDYLTNIRKEHSDLIPVSQDKLDRIAQTATKDGLTGLYDHATFKTLLEHELERTKRYQSRLSLVILDIDDFKQINDRWGHQVGDAILRQIAKQISETIRSADIPARYGGEEFIIILPETDINHGLEISERIRAKIEQTSLKHRPVTVSVGIAESNMDTDMAELIEHADKALYRAKHSGKNRVVTYNEH